jgi:large subunit ribosomal protein L18
MIKKDTTKRRLHIKKTIRKRVFGSVERPRFSVYRSLNDIYGQIIDDTTGKTIVALSTNSKEIREEVAAVKTKTAQSTLVGQTARKEGDRKECQHRCVRPERISVSWTCEGVRRWRARRRTEILTLVCRAVQLSCRPMAGQRPLEALI